MPFKGGGQSGAKASAITRMDLFHPERLTATSFEAAVAAFGKAVLSRPASEDILRELLSEPHWIEIGLSAVPVGVYTMFQETILDRFPKTVAAFELSVASPLVQRLSTSLFLLPCGRSSDELLEHNRELGLLLPALAALPKFGFGVPATPVSPDDEFGGFAVKKKKPSQKAMKRARQASMQPLPDKALYERSGLWYPETEDEVKDLEDYMLNRIQTILRDYLAILRRADFVSAIQEAYLSINAVPERLREAIKLVVDSGATTAVSGLEQNLPSSEYSVVQPMRTTLYFDPADGFGDWRISMNGRALGTLREAYKRAPARYDIYMKKLRELSHGMFSADNQKRLVGPNAEIPIYEAKMTGDSRLVYRVDCVAEYDSEVERQILVVYGIYTHAQLDGRFWDMMSSTIGRKGKEYRKRCIFRNRPMSKGDYVVLPASFPEPLAAGPAEPVASLMPARPEDLEELHSLLVLEKFVTLSQALLNSILADQDAQHVFDVSPNEKHIIEHNSSCYVLGRSGTGKTTTMLFKMLGIERSWEVNCFVGPKPRQVFVTQSRVLASKVEEYFGKLLNSLASARGTSEDVEQAAKAMDRLVDEDEEENWRGDLPLSFSALEDHHFPLFVTYDRLCKLLEADVGISESSHMRSPTVESPTFSHLRSPTLESASSPVASKARTNSIISYYDFLGSYWGHFPQSLTKNLDPALVYSEFLGVIKGSEATLKRDEGYIDRDTYLKLSHRSNSLFASRRDIIWRLFEVYLKRKRSLGHRDAADRTRNILRHSEGGVLSGHKVDFLYVDEAQDNLLIDALVLRSICRNPDGLFWAGDTAQTIANGGSAFRFDDLKSFLYRVETELRKRKDYPAKSADPKAFQLSVNYRSHGGIVGCASSVVRIITKFWPYSIDAMQEETGIVDGLKPVVFSGWDEKAIRYEQFLFGEGGSHMEFGAQQCILVRNDAARDKLRSEVGDIGLIMTLYESKGLEFNDVLLFNFFQDSTVDLPQWRVILNMLPDGSSSPVACPQFDEMRHAGVCAELKFLYVAITRARKNLWIIDCSDKGEPLRVFWTAQDLIENCTPGSKVPQLAVSSTAEEWARSGRTLFRSKRYFQAMHCYERASMPREMAIAHSYLMRETARNMSGGSKLQESERAQAFAQAADAFYKCAENEKGEDQKTYFRIAGKCYAEANENFNAGTSFYAASEYTHSARYYRKGDFFDEAVKVVQSHAVEPAYATTLIDIAKLYYIASGVPEKAAPLFDTIEDQLEYMEEADLDTARASLLESLDRISEAADIHMAEGRPMRALEILLNDKHNESSLRRGKEQLLEYLWRHMSFGISFGPKSINLFANELLHFVDQLDVTRLSQQEANEFAMFKAISINDSVSLRQLAERFKSENNTAAALHCLDHVFRNPPNMQTASDQDMVGYLRRLYDYVLVLRLASTEPKSHEKRGMRWLFALSMNNEDDTYLVSVGTYLHEEIIRLRWPCLQLTEEGAHLSPDQASEYISRALSDVLKTRVTQHEISSRELATFESCCIQHAVFSGCHRGQCKRQHIDMKSVNRIWYSRRVGLHLLQILVLQTSQALLSTKDRAIQQRLWLSKLYEVVFPPYYTLGSPSLWDRDLLVETSRAIDVVQDWLRELVYTIDPLSRVQSTRFLAFFMQANALAKILGQNTFVDYIWRARCMVDLRPRAFMRSSQGDYILNDCVEMTLGRSAVSVAQGLLFACHVLEKYLPMDISVFCDYLDQICTVVSVDNRLKRHGRLNDVMLPRNWLLQLVQWPQAPPIQADYSGLLTKLLSQLPSILNLLASEDEITQESVLFAGRPLYKHGFLVRQIFVARICKTLALLAYNTWYGVRDQVFRCLKSLAKPGRRPHALYAEYVEAREAHNLTPLARRSAAGSSLDEMVQVFHKPLLPIAHRELPGVRRVVYSHTEDLVPLLENRSTLRPEAAEFKPREALVIQPEVEEPKPEEDNREDNENSGFELALVNITQVHVVSKEEHTAATRVQRAYKRYLRRKLPATETPIASSRRALFDQLAKASQDLAHVGFRYRQLFLGPLAHALLCAEKTQQWVFHSKKKTKRQLANVKTGDLEEIRARQTKTNALLKRARDVQRALEPKSKIHVEADAVQLRAQVVLLQQLVQELPPGSVHEVDDDLRMAVEAIVMERVLPPVAEPLRPVLVLDDPCDLLDDL